VSRRQAATLKELSEELELSVASGHLARINGNCRGDILSIGVGYISYLMHRIDIFGSNGVYKPQNL
jgi:hypothetical protein